MDMSILHTPVYEKINPNGRVPAITDPNTGITLWESGAIIEYLIETYDTQQRLTTNAFPDRYHLKQWLYFQTSGQGPYFGQAAWFSHFHPERIESATTRYRDQVLRVLGVLDRALDGGKQYLVADKCTYVDLSFLTWDNAIPWIFGDDYPALGLDKKFPNYWTWRERLLARPAVKKVFADKMAAMTKHH
jgi:glutathione S-transferase